MRNTLQKSRQIVSLTGMRAFLIGWIVLYHLKEEIDQLFPQQAWLSDFAATGFVGVDFFFLTSGFIITYNYATRFRSFNTQVYGRFLWMRLARIYPVHLFSFLLYAALIALMAAVGMQPSNPEFYTPSGFIQNIFLVQAWTIPTAFSWNAVAWAVSAEWLAYLCFPLVLALTLRIHRSLTVVASIVTLLWTMAAVCLFLDTSWTVPYGAGSYGLLRMAGEFTAGCLLYNLYVTGFGSQWRWGWITTFAWISSVVGSVFINSAKGQGLLSAAQMSGQLHTLWITPLFALAIYALAWEKGIVAKAFSTSTMRYGGHCSYALYLTHFLCLILLRKVFPASAFADASIVLKVAFLAGYLTVMLAAATLTYRLIEEPARKWMKRLNSQRDRSLRTAAVVQRTDRTVTPDSPHTARTHASDSKKALSVNLVKGSSR